MGKDHIRLQFRNMFACQSRDLLRTGENGEAFHQQRVANAVVIIDGDGDDGARLKASGGAADAHPPLLAQAIKGAIEAADLPAAKGQLVQKIYGGQGAARKEDRPTGFVQIGAASNNGQLPVADPVRKAMGLE